jgi:GNAT superfamily N-acetyltransferase
MMVESSYRIRLLEQHEIVHMLDMARLEGWNPGLEDHLAFYAADPEGFFVGEIAGKPIAYISAVSYNNIYGFVGLYIVDAAYRGYGYGYRLWNHAIQRIRHLPCGLDGVPSQQENYRKSGFVYAFRQMRLTCKALSVPQPTSVHKLTPDDDFNGLVAYDSKVFGTKRAGFLRAWSGMSNAVLFCTRDQQKEITGYAVMRKCTDGYKIGPLFAGNIRLAGQLFLACHSAALPGENVYIDMPEPNPATQSWTDRYGLELVFETARMYTNGGPGFSMEQVFGVTTFELG